MSLTKRLTVNPSPPFAEYVSGHSTFSGAGAAVLAQFTHSDAFGAAVTFNTGSSRFEPGLVPAETLTLSWDTFTQAADEAGISRLYGGIHFADGDLNGRKLGRDVGNTVWSKIQQFADAYAPVVSLFREPLAVPTNGLVPVSADYQANVYRTGFEFSEVTPEKGIVLLLSFDSGTAVLHQDFDWSLEASRNITGIRQLEDGSALVSIAGGVSKASLAMVPATSRTGFKTIETRVIDGLGYRVAAADSMSMSLLAPSADELIDLRGSEANTLRAQVNVYCEAVYDNLVGFYRTNEGGDVLDAQGRVVAATGTDAYRRAVVDHRLDAVVVGEGAYDLAFEGRSLLGTFLIANGSLDKFDINRVYVSGIGNNADKRDHIRKLGETVFAFEDMAGGGDRDFNDTIISIRF